MIARAKKEYSVSEFGQIINEYIDKREFDRIDLSIIDHKNIDSVFINYDRGFVSFHSKEHTDKWSFELIESVFGIDGSLIDISYDGEKVVLLFYKHGEEIPEGSDILNLTEVK